MRIRHDLELDVARVDNQFFEIHVRLAERFLGLLPRRVETLHEAHVVVRRAHAPAAAAGAGFDHDGITDLLGNAQGFGLGFHDAVAAGRDRHAGGTRGIAGSVLVAHRADGVGGRPDETDVAARADFREMGVFREETVPRMNGVHVTDLGGADETVDLQVAVAARRRADANGLVGKLDVEAFFVGLRIDGDGFNAHFAAGAHDAQGDLAAVGDEDFVKHKGKGRDISGVAGVILTQRTRRNTETGGDGKRHEQNLFLSVLLRSLCPPCLRVKISPSTRGGRADHSQLAANLLEPEERLPELHRLAVFDEDFRDDAGLLGLDFVHDLHRLDDANDHVRRDALTDLYIRRRIR